MVSSHSWYATTTRRWGSLLADWGSLLSKTPTFPSSRNAGSWSLHPGQGSPGSYWPGHHRPNRSRALARRPEGGSSYSSTPMTYGVTTSATKRKALSLFALPSRSRTAPLRYSKTSTAICGTFCRQTGRAVPSPNNALEQTAGSHSLAAAAPRAFGAQDGYGVDSQGHDRRQYRSAAKVERGAVFERDIGGAPLGAHARSTRVRRGAGHAAEAMG